MENLIWNRLLKFDKIQVRIKKFYIILVLIMNLISDNGNNNCLYINIRGGNFGEKSKD